MAKRQRISSAFLEHHDFMATGDAVSHNEMTGLIPSKPDDDFESNSYEAIIDDYKAD